MSDTREQQEREEARRKAAERKRQEKDAAQAQVLAEIAKADEAAHQQLQLAQQLATAVVEAASVGEEAGSVESQQSLLASGRTAEYQAMAAVPTATATAALTRGRPSDYTDEEGDRICAWIAEGRSLRSYCRLEGRAVDTVYRWLRERRDFRERYARAHEDRADSLADEITDIADEVASGTSEEIQAARLRVDARKWVASKLRPSKWGEYQADTAKTNITFNIGIRPAHNPAPTIIDNPLPVLESSPDK